MSLASPIVLNKKKTPSRKITAGFRGTVFEKVMVELMGLEVLDRALL
jgi:hypothetical protein